MIGAVVLAVTLHAPAGPLPSLAVLPAFGEGGFSEVERAVQAVAAGDGRVKALGEKAVRTHLADAAALGIKCDAAEAGCLSRLGAFASTDYVLGLEVTGTNDARVLTLLFIDVTAEREVRRRVSPLVVGKEAAIAQELAKALLSDREARGALLVHAAPGSALMVGDRWPGQPEQLIDDIPAGEHTLVAEVDDLRYEAKIEVVAGTTHEHTIEGGAWLPVASGKVDSGAARSEPAPLGSSSAGDAQQGASPDEQGVPWLLLSGVGAGLFIALVGVVVGWSMVALGAVLAPTPETRGDLSAAQYNLNKTAARGLAIAGVVALVGLLGAGAGAAALGAALE